MRSSTTKINMKHVQQFLISKQNITQKKLRLVERLDKKKKQKKPNRLDTKVNALIYIFNFI